MFSTGVVFETLFASLVFHVLAIFLVCAEQLLPAVLGYEAIAGVMGSNSPPVTRNALCFLLPNTMSVSLLFHVVGNPAVSTRKTKLTGKSNIGDIEGILG